MKKNIDDLWLRREEKIQETERRSAELGSVSKVLKGKTIKVDKNVENSNSDNKGRKANYWLW